MARRYTSDMGGKEFALEHASPGDHADWWMTRSTPWSRPVIGSHDEEMWPQAFRSTVGVLNDRRGPGLQTPALDDLIRTRETGSASVSPAAGFRLISIGDGAIAVRRSRPSLTIDDQYASFLARTPAPYLPIMWILLFLAGIWAGAQNALAGGGSFVTLPTLILSGLDARAANITSTIALFPGQVTTGIAGHGLVSGTEKLSFPILLMLSLAGGVLGALLLLSTPADFFSHLVPWLVLFATVIFIWGSFRKSPGVGSNIGPVAAAAMQFSIAIYGGYFGGGIGFLMLAALTLAGLDVRSAGATKNILAAAMNASAVMIFVASRDVHWLQAVVLGGGAMLGGLFGAWALKRIDTRFLRIGVIILGLSLTVGLFWRGK